MSSDKLMALKGAGIMFTTAGFSLAVWAFFTTGGLFGAFLVIVTGLSIVFAVVA